ncbi:MAG: tripartite tricarboxylate transporter permease [Planctomycetota bacterium]|jgi:putative tricarboxylic transport membrane protein|nr:tripartite tricarboxylate transporter permease [Planctomycetota bacterium]
MGSFIAGTLDYLGLIVESGGMIMDVRILLTIFGGSVMGLMVGVIPGLTATMALALLINISYGMEIHVAIAFLLAVYVGSTTGGLGSAIMMNIPGTPAAAATALDGFPLAKQGKGGMAIGFGYLASFLGTILSTLIMLFLTPLIYLIALKFGHWEMFLLALFGIMICGSLSTDQDPLKGWLVGFIGFLAAMVGMEPIYAYPRFTFDLLQLNGGIPLIPALIGVFGISEVLTVLQESTPYKIEGNIGRVIPNLKVFRPFIPAALRSTVIGSIVGAIPGAGEDIGAWMAYDIGRRRSKHPELFGKGAIEGVICPEVANNAVIGGAMIPMLTLAIPGSAPNALMMAAMQLHGIRPGPTLNDETPWLLPYVGIALFAASLAMVFWGFTLAKPMIAILKIKREILLPLVVPLTLIGAYAAEARLFNIYVMFFFGVLGYILRRMDYPMAPLVLGIILGPIADISFRRALMQSRGAILPLLERPIGIILILCLLLIIYAGVKRIILFYRPRRVTMTSEILEGIGGGGGQNAEGKQ